MEPIYIGDQLFCELEGGPIPVHEPGQVRIEPAAPDVVRPRLPDANLAQPMEEDIVEYLHNPWKRT